jgi:hypothetical protein
LPGATRLQEKLGELQRTQYLARLRKFVDLDPTFARHMREAEVA